MGATLSCDVCERAINGADGPHISEHVYTLTGEKEEHVCVVCYEKEPSKYGAHVKKLAEDVIQAANDETAEKVVPKLEKAVETWNKYEYRACKNCSAETAVHPGVVACFACKTPF